MSVDPARRSRCFRVGGITIRLEADTDFNAIPLSSDLSPFAVEDAYSDDLGRLIQEKPSGGARDTITLRHHFDGVPSEAWDWGKDARRNRNLSLSQLDSGEWVYGVFSTDGTDRLQRTAVFSADYRRADIYSDPDVLEHLRAKGWRSLSLLPSDQVWLGPPLAERSAIMIHSAAAVINGRGIVFIAPSTTGKSSTMELLKAARGRVFDGTPLEAEILCDDRNILRRHPEAGGASGWSVYGTWYHSSTPDVSPGPAPLRAVLFLEASPDNAIVPFEDRKFIWQKLLRTLYSGVMTAEWRQKQADVVGRIVDEVPFYLMRFDKSTAIVPKLVRLVGRTGW